MSKRSNLRAIRRLQDKEYDYSCWIEENESKRKLALKHKPLFSLVLFIEDATEQEQKRCLRSIKKQHYKELERIIVSEKNIEWKNLKEQIKGEYVIFLSMKSFLAKNAIREIAYMLEQHPQVQWLYSDEDTWRESEQKRVQPKFKPEWSYDTFLSFFYTGNLAIYKTDLCKKIKDWSSEYSKYWHYDFALRFLEVCNQDYICHIPKVLFHAPSDVSEHKDNLREEVQRIKTEFLKRNRIDARLEWEEHTGEWRVVYDAKGLVSILIPSKDNPRMLCDCVDSIKNHTSYNNYEIVVVDNGSNAENRKLLIDELQKRDVTYIYEKMDFNFSKMCNIAAKNAKGEFLLFLNDDIECIDENWLERMLGQASQPGVGAVGAKLLYPEENKIQHAGVINLGFGPSHILTRQKDEGVLADGRNCLDYNFEAVTAACLLVKRENHDRIGSFDESLPVAYNDVDYCYRLREEGLRNVLRTDAVLIHHESISRGLDVIDDKKMARLEQEREYLYQKHPWIIKDGDGCYSPNFSLYQTDFSLRNDLDFSQYNGEIRQKRYTNLAFTVIIDKIKMVKDLHITGWYWYVDDEYTNTSDVFVVFKNQDTGKEVWYEATKQVRLDVKEALNNQAIYCGFTCSIKRNEAKRLKNSKVGLCVQRHPLKNKAVAWTEEIID